MTVDYGTDLNFDGLDMAADGGLVSGLDLLTQAVIIRLSTPRGSVIDAPDDGIDLKDYLSKGLTAADAEALSGTIETELYKDERISHVTATVDISLLVSEGSFSVSLVITAAQGPFRLTLGVSDAGVAILGGA